MKNGTLLLGAAGLAAVAFVLLKKDKEPQPAQGLGFSWPWSKDYYTVWTGLKWLPARYLTYSQARDWYLNTMEQNWNRTVLQYKAQDGRWIKV